MILRKRSYYFFGSLAVVSGLLVACVLAFTSTATPRASASNNSTAGDHIVTIYDGSESKSLITRASTVAQALDEAGITVDHKLDLIEPGLDTQITSNDFSVNIHRARVVTIVEGVRRTKVTTAQRTPSQIAQVAGINLYKEDTVSLSLALDVSLDGSGVVMKIDRAKQRTVTEEVPVQFAVEQTRDNTRPIGYKEVKQVGETGVRTITYQVQAENGVEVSRREVASAITKEPKKQIEIVGAKPANPLTKSKGAHIFTDSRGVAHRETYYDLPMNIVISACGGGGYTVREDGAKVDKDGYILVAANYGNYPRCSVVETSMGPGKVYDTGGFAVRHPHGFDLATDWTKADGR